MTKEEADKISTKYDFLIDHHFLVNGVKLYVVGITTEEDCEHDGCEVYILLKHENGTERKEMLGRFLTKVGAAFWIKYFHSLRS